MDIKKILIENGVSSEVVDTIADTIKAEIPKEFVSKVQYSKKVGLIDELNNTIADLEAKAGNDDFKTKYEELNNQFEEFKNGLEVEKVNSKKKDLIVSNLKKEGFNDKIVNLLLKEFDLDKIEVEEDNIKGWEDTITPLKETYSDFIQIEATEGQPPASPTQQTTGGAEPTSLREALKMQYNM